MQLQDLEYMYHVPDFVKKASSAELDPADPDAVLVGDNCRIDTKASAWCTAATLRKNASIGKHAPLSVRKRIDEACRLFDITDSDFQLKSLTGEHVLVKKANYNADFIICNQEQFDEAVESFLQKRASAPIQFCRECADQLLKISDKYDYKLSPENEGRLYKLAGTCHHDMEGFAREIDKRVRYAAIMHLPEAQDALKKMASISRETADDHSGILANVLVDAVDEFDHATGLIEKLASENMKHPEEVMFLLPEEHIRKKASMELKIGKRGIQRGYFMKVCNQDEIRKWASSCGVYIDPFASPEDFASVIGGMSGYLQDEFFERVENGECFDSK